MPAFPFTTTSLALAASTLSSLAAMTAMTAMSAMSAPALAQTPPPATATGASASAGAQASLQAVVVTGTRRSDRSLAESESPVDVIDAAELRRSGSTELATALAQLLPSLNFPRPSLTDASDAVRPAQLRGLSPDQTLVLIDGKRRHSGSVVNINGTQGRGSAPVDLNAIPIAAIDRVEVLRDGAAAQYGSDAIAGVINIVLKKGPTGGSIAGDWGQTDAGDGGRAIVSAQFGLALGDAGWLRLAAENRHQQRTNRAGVDTRDAATEPRRGQVNNRLGDPDSTQQSVILNGQLEAAGLQVYSVASYSHRDTVSAAFWRTQATAVANNVGSLYPEGFLPLEDSTSQDASLVLGVRGQAGAWQWDASLNHGRNEFDIAVANTANYSLGAASPTRFDAGRLSNRQTLANVDASREIDWGGFRPAVLSVGAEWRQERYSIEAGEPGSYTGGGASGFPGFQPSNAGSHRRDNVSVYAGLEGSWTRDFSTSVAARVEDYSDFGHASALKLSGRYVVASSLSVRGTLSSGFRAPSLAQQYFATTSTNLINGALVEAGTFPVGSAAAQALGAQPLKAEKSRQASLGLQWQPTRQWQTTLDVYQIDIDHRILLSANLSLPTALRNQLAAQGVLVSAGRYFTNALDTRTRGVDLVSSLQQDWGVGGRGTYTLAFNHNKNSIRGVDANPQVLTDNNLQLIDRVTLARATVSAPTTKLLLAAQHQWGAWNARVATTRYGHYEVRQSNPVNDQRFSAAWLVDVSAGWTQGPWDAQLGVENLGNRYPDPVLAANSVGGILRYSSFSPFGFNGRQYVAKLAYRW
ncbi:TonB-dependent receptor plug domain-containing protein [Roseateles depolymerans]|uniref:TonB-dependent siderophore receptor n=1 Tax=Roseateles depolymerans TaxID=76731 RepID=A0A0U3CZH2_9BURK|nr:TonB-dependent receptor [Roseateles depolymerans]ALV06726.1 TonB-dependent siderophore receptor [Roseateles depolymerans]REG19703.1 iron complex outermembrane receptor protein [Roseateles depolymerans]